MGPSSVGGGIKGGSTPSQPHLHRGAHHVEILDVTAPGPEVGVVEVAGEEQPLLAAQDGRQLQLLVGLQVVPGQDLLSPCSILHLSWEAPWPTTRKLL